jgi:integrase
VQQSGRGRPGDVIATPGWARGPGTARRVLRHDHDKRPAYRSDSQPLHNVGSGAPVRPGCRARASNWTRWRSGYWPGTPSGLVSPQPEAELVPGPGAELHLMGEACAQRLLAAEQSLLLVRLAADCGARRGEPAGLRLSDLDGRSCHRANPVRWRPWPDQVGEDPEGNPRARRTRSGATSRPGRPGSSRRGTGCSARRRGGRLHDSRRSLAASRARGRPRASGMRLYTASATAWPPTWWRGVAAQGPGLPRPPGPRQHLAALPACHPAR